MRGECIVMGKTRLSRGAVKSRKEQLGLRANTVPPQGAAADEEETATKGEMIWVPPGVAKSSLAMGFLTPGRRRTSRNQRIKNPDKPRQAKNTATCQANRVARVPTRPQPEDEPTTTQRGERGRVTGRSYEQHATSCAERFLQRDYAAEGGP